MPIPLTGDPSDPRGVNGADAGTYSLHSADLARAGLPVTAAEVGLRGSNLEDGIHPQLATIGGIYGVVVNCDRQADEESQKASQKTQRHGVDLDCKKSWTSEWIGQYCTQHSRQTNVIAPQFTDCRLCQRAGVSMQDRARVRIGVTDLSRRLGWIPQRYEFHPDPFYSRTTRFAAGRH